MKQKQEMTECFLCKGKGKIPTHKVLTKNEKREMRAEASRLLVANGYSFRETAKLLGYKSPQSITKAMNQKKK